MMDAARVGGRRQAGEDKPPHYDPLPLAEPVARNAGRSRCDADLLVGDGADEPGR